MRILMLSNVPLEERLGSAYVTLGFARGLIARGHHVDVVGPEVLEWYKFLRKGRLQRLAWGVRSHVARHATSGKYDVVELYGGQNCRAARLLYRLNRRKFLVVAHSNGIEMHASEVFGGTEKMVDSGWRAWMKRWTDLPIERTFSEVDGIVTVSHYDLQYARRERLQSPERIHAIENGLPDVFLDAPFGGKRTSLIGFVGSSVVERRHLQYRMLFPW
jgi:hypothetical protein